MQYWNYVLCYLWFKKRGWYSALERALMNTVWWFWKLMVREEQRSSLGAFRVKWLAFVLIEMIVAPPLFISEFFVFYCLLFIFKWHTVKEAVFMWMQSFLSSCRKSACHRQSEHVFPLSWLGAQIFYVCCFLPCCLDDHWLSLRMSGSRKEFDVKQILKIRWRWFGHQTSAPNSAIENDQGDFWNRGQNVTTGGTKFLDSSNLPLTAAGYRRSSQQDFQNSPPWPMASTSEIPAFEFAAEDCGGARWLDRQETDDRASEEENESDSSSCRLIITFLLWEMCFNFLFTDSMHILVSLYSGLKCCRSITAAVHQKQNDL